jgi:hypothetical protein
VTPSHASATAVVQAAITALEEERWADVVSLVRPEALRRHRDSHLRWMVESEQRKARTPEELQAEQPWLPREVAAFYAEQEQQHVSGALPVTRAQWGVASFRELETLSPAEFFARYLAASTPAAKLRIALAVSHKPPPDVESAVQEAEAAHRRRWIVLGEVAEGTRTSHVVYREQWGGDGADDVPGGVRVTTLDYVDGRWWLRIDHTLLAEQGWSFAWALDEEDAPAADAEEQNESTEEQS